MNKMAKRRWALFGLWILSLTAISFFGGTISYGFFFGITLIPVISFVYLVFVYVFFRIYQKVESRDMVCGEPAPYFFVLQNDGYYPFAGVGIRMFSSFSYVEKVPENTEFELLRGDKYLFETKIICKYRGEYEVGVKAVVVTDFFRLFCFEYKIPSTIRAIVKPRITRVSALNSIGEILGVLQTERFNVGGEPDVLVRDYVDGDAIKNISWSATAREQKLKVRNRIIEEKQGIVLFGDTRRYSRQIEEYLPLENKMLEIMAALGIFFAEKNMAFTAWYGQNGIQNYRVGSMQEYNAYYESISKINFSKTENIGQTMLKLMQGGTFSSCKVAFGVLHEMTGEIMEIAVRLSELSTTVVLYVVTEEKYEEYVKQSNERIKIITVPIEAELEGRL